MCDPQLFIGMPIYQLGEERSTKGLVRALQKGDVPAMRTAARILQRYPSARFDVKPGTLLSIARAELAAAFVESRCDYWLSLDQDIEFDLDVLEGLIAADGDVVLATYPMRGAPEVMPLGFGKPNLHDLPFRTTRLATELLKSKRRAWAARSSRVACSSPCRKAPRATLLPLDQRAAGNPAWSGPPAMGPVQPGGA